jgi:hypothetical protein
VNGVDASTPIPIPSCNCQYTPRKNHVQMNVGNGEELSGVRQPCCRPRVDFMPKTSRCCYDTKI